MPPQSQTGISPVRNRPRTRGSGQMLLPRVEKRMSSSEQGRGAAAAAARREYGAQTHAHPHDHASHKNGHSFRHNQPQHQNQHQHQKGDLRVAYKAQSNNNNNNNSNSNSNSNSHGFMNMFDSSDQHSISAGSAANSAATPSSVYMPSSVALSRDNMSDLSGVSGGTHRGSSSHNIPGQIFDPKSLMKPWKQAYDLSNIPPEQCRNTRKLQQQQSESELLMSSSSSTSGAATGRNKRSALHNYNYNDDDDDDDAGGSTSIWVAQNDVVEIFDNLQSSLGLDRFQIMGGQHNRIPVMILLMDPPKQSYELMQIWVDRAIDSIRDLVQVLQHKLPDKWKQAYDGLFQVRGHRFTQLINIIRLVKYDIQPHEILVAKPWAMTAKVTIAFAGSAIRHLTRIGVITTDNNETSGIDKEQQRQRQQPKNEDSPLLLSKRAKDRVYFPEGILNHHHAMQFMTFSPPFESANYTTAAVSSAETAAGTTNLSSSQYNSSNSKPGSDHCLDDAFSSSLGSDSSYQRNSGLAHTGNVVASLGGGRRSASGSSSRRQKSSQSFSKRGRNNNDNDNNNNRSTTSAGGPCTDIKILTTSQRKRRGRGGSGSCSRGGLFSKLNCFRNSTSNVATKLRKSDIGNTNAPLPSLSEEEEKRWLAYSMKPIAEDQSLAGASIVSMSAPLLSPTVTSQLANNNTRRQQTFAHPQHTVGTNF